jgi:hypothetical protein
MEVFMPLQDDLKGEVRKRILARSIHSTAEAEAQPQNGAERQPVGAADLAELRHVCRSVKATYALVGAMPPEPPTLRGRMGSSLIRVVRRLLFWYTPQIVHFHAAVADAVERQQSAIESLARSQQELLQENQRLQRRIKCLEEMSELPERNTSAGNLAQ